MRSLLGCFFIVVALGGCGGCGRTEPDMKHHLPVRGLFTDNASGETAPPGSLATADNVTFDKRGALEPRRGFALAAGTLSGAVNQMIFYAGYLIAHHGATGMSRSSDLGASWTAFSGTFTPPDSNTKVRFAEMAGSLFCTLQDGVYELDSPTGTWRLTGAPAGLDSTATLRRTSNETGFATADGQWAYQVVWVYVNANGRIQLGAPSGRFLVTAPANVVATTANIAKLNGATTVTVTNTTHGFATGEYVDVTLGGAETYFAAGRFQVTVVSATSFTYSDAVNNGSGITQNPGANITYGFSSRNVDLDIPIPSGVTASFKAQLYRTGESASATSEPSEFLGLVYERSPTNLEITAGTMTVTDLVVDGLRGADLYTSIESPLASKYRPPASKDLALFHRSGFYIDTAWFQTLDFQLLAVGGTTGIASGDKLVFRLATTEIVSDTIGVTVEGASTESAGIGQFKVYTTGSVAQNIADTAKSIVRAINGFSSNTMLYAAYSSGANEAPGKIRVYARATSTSAYTVQIFNASSLYTREYLYPQVPRQALVATGQIMRAANVVTVNTSQDHGFAAGQQIVLERQAGAAEANISTGTKTVATIVDPNTFTYNEAGSNHTSTSAYATASQPLDRTLSFNQDYPNRLCWSAPDEPWACPFVHEFFAGNSRSIGLKLTPTRDRLFLWSEAGLWQVTGEYPNFVVSEVETPLRLIAPETAVAIAGKAYGLTDQGVVEVVETPRLISGPIQSTLKDLRASASTELLRYAFAVPYVSEAKYLMALPTAAGVTTAGQIFVQHQNAFGDWTRWPVNATCGTVDPTTDKLFLGTSSGTVWVENKARTSADYYDTSASVTVEASPAPTATTATLTSATGVTVGDYIVLSTGEGTVIRSVSGNDITFDTVEDTGDGAATVYKHFTSTVRWLRQDMGDVSSEKLVDSGQLNFIGASGLETWKQASLDFATSYEPSFNTSQTISIQPDSSTILAPDTFLPFWVPATKERGMWHQPQFSHAEARKVFYLTGMDLNYRVTGRGGGY